MQEVEKRVTDSNISFAEFTTLQTPSKESQAVDRSLQKTLGSIDQQTASPPGATTNTPTSDQENKILSFRFSLKKGAPTKNLETPLETWRMILVNMALLIAGFVGRFYPNYTNCSQANTLSRWEWINLL
jgi:hypothetical protein